MLEINTLEENTIYEIQVNGDIDANSSIHLDKAFLSALESRKNIVINFSNLNYMSSAGFGVIISHLNKIHEKNNKLVIYGLSEKVFKVFTILGLDELIAIRSDKQKALNFLSEK